MSLANPNVVNPRRRQRVAMANHLQAGLWKSFAVRDSNLVTGHQNFSGAAIAELVIRALGE